MRALPTAAKDEVEALKKTMTAKLVVRSEGRRLDLTKGPTREFPGLDHLDFQIEIEAHYSTTRFVFTPTDAARIRDWLIEATK